MTASGIKRQIPFPDNISNSSIIFIASIFFASVIFPQSLRAEKLSRKQVYSDGTSVWFVYPGKFLKHGEEQDEWSWVTRDHGLKGGDLRFFKLDEDIIWAATSDGLLNSDIRYNDWLLYDASTGFPSGEINDVAFGDDDVWIGTNGGAVRLDKYVDEITVFTRNDGMESDSVSAVFVSGDYVWAGTPGGICRYDPEFETWRNFYNRIDLADPDILDIFEFKGYIWFLAERTIIRYDEENESFKVFGKEDGYVKGKPLEVFLFQEEIYVTAEDEIVVYNTSLDAWSPFRFMEELPSRTVYSLIVGDETIWFATGKGVSKFDPSSGEWNHHTAATGIMDDRIDFIYEGSRYLYAPGEGGINYFDMDEEIWRFKEISSADIPELDAEDRKKPPLIDLSTEGLELNAAGGKGMLLSGRYTLLANSSGDTGKPPPVPSVELRALALLNGALGKDRMLNGYYDNTSISERLYGLTYRGSWDDNLRLAHGGFYSSRLVDSDILAPLSSEGINIVVEGGKRHDVIKRRTFQLETSAGLRRGRYITEIFEGNLRAHTDSIPSSDYSSGIFYHLHADPSELPVTDGSESIYLKVDAATYLGTYPIVENSIVANIEGDWIRLVSGLDYSVDYADGIVLTASSYGAGDTLAATYESRMGGNEVKLRAGEGDDRELTNRYKLGAADIIPLNFSLQVTDSLGNDISLSGIGLDENGDGLVDAERIDFKNGYLAFPGFSNPLLDAGTGHVILVEFKTSSANFYLEHQDIIINSESIYIDGVQSERNEDYLMVYPTGKVIFINEDLLGEDSVIEARYEYKINDYSERERVMALDATFSPGDYITLNAGYRGISGGTADSGANAPGAASRRDLFNVGGEYRFMADESGFSLRVKPELVLEKGEDGEFSRAFGSRLITRWGRFELDSGFENYEQDFEGTGSRLGEAGILRERYSGDLTMRVLSWLPVSGGWNYELAEDEDSGIEREKTEHRGSILLAGKGLPRISLDLLDKDLVDPSLDHNEKRIELNLDHEFSAEALKRLHLHRLRLLSFYRRSYSRDTEGNTSLFSRSGDFYLGAKFSPHEIWYFNADYKNYRLWEKSDSGYNEVVSLHELEFTSITDILRGFSTSSSFEGDYRRDLADITDDKSNVDFNLRGSFSINLYPGEWIDFLEPVLLNAGVSETRNEFFELVEDDEDPLALIDTEKWRMRKGKGAKNGIKEKRSGWKR